MKNPTSLKEAPDTVETELRYNQTNFFNEELLEQSPPTLPVEPDPFQAQKDALRKKNKKLFILLGTAAVGVLCIGGAILLVLTPTPDTTLVVLPSPITVSNSSEKSELTKRLDELEKDLKASDPIEVENPFPPVSFDLYLDQIKR